jgi:hypothetical protein
MGAIEGGGDARRLARHVLGSDDPVVAGKEDRLSSDRLRLTGTRWATLLWAMPPGRYYKQRLAGPDGQPPRLPLDKIGKMLSALYLRARETQWFDELFGKNCVDDRDQYLQGKAGSDPDGFIFSQTWVENATPIEERLQSRVDETTLFTLIEFLYDHVSFGIEDSKAHRHDYLSCGWHYENYAKAEAQATWRREVNAIIGYYGEGFQLNEAGEVERTMDAPGLRDLLTAPLPKGADAKMTVAKVDEAIRKFRSGKSRFKDRQDAIRELADVLEFLRPKAKLQLLSDDEKDLYKIANNYGIRHHQKNQKTEYRSAWLSFLFYLYLANIHLLSHLEDPKEDLR